MTTPDEREVQRLLRRLLAESEEQFRALQIIELDSTNRIERWCVRNPELVKIKEKGDKKWQIR